MNELRDINSSLVSYSPNDIVKVIMNGTVKELVTVPFTPFSSEGLGICFLSHHHMSQIFRGQLPQKWWKKSHDLQRNVQI